MSGRVFRSRIDLGSGRSCRVSPRDREGFLAALLEAGVAPQALPPAAGAGTVPGSSGQR